MKKRLFIGLVAFCLSFPLIAKEAVFSLSTASQGVVDAVHVTPGSKVKKGQVLVDLDRRVYKAKLDEAVANLSSMRLDFEEEKKELERAEELYERTVTSDRDLSVAKIAFSEAQAKLKQIERKEIEARYNYEHSQLLAPFNGKIKTVYAFSGMLVINQMKATVLMTMEK